MEDLTFKEPPKVDYSVAVSMLHSIIKQLENNKEIELYEATQDVLKEAYDHKQLQTINCNIQYIVDEIMRRSKAFSSNEMIVDIISKSGELPKKATEGSFCYDIKAFWSHLKADDSRPDLPITNTPFIDHNGCYYDVDEKGRNFLSIPPLCRALVHTGLYVGIAEGEAIKINSRSGLAITYQVFVLNAPGIIDSDYRGGSISRTDKKDKEIGVILQNLHPSSAFIITEGDRIAQLEGTKRIIWNTVTDITPLASREGGFGSTNK